MSRGGSLLMSVATGVPVSADITIQLCGESDTFNFEMQQELIRRRRQNEMAKAGSSRTQLLVRWTCSLSVEWSMTLLRGDSRSLPAAPFRWGLVHAPLEKA